MVPKLPNFVAAILRPQLWAFVHHQSPWGARVSFAQPLFYRLDCRPYGFHRMGNIESDGDSKNGQPNTVGKHELKVQKLLDNSQDELLAPAHSQADTGNVRENQNDGKLEIARQVLAEKFGYNSFRHEQEAAINHVLQGKNTLVIFPTGAGKSLCYQVPALAYEKIDYKYPSIARRPGDHGLTIIICPLVSLMKGQIDILQSRGIRADSINSTKTPEEIQQVRLALQKGELRMLYCSPERFTDESFIQSMKEVPGGIRLVAIDETHCISEWGHSFRPDYLKVPRFVKEVGAESVICLTATATPTVVKEICESLSISSSGVFRTSPYRPNLHLHAEPAKDDNDRCERILEILSGQPGSSLIYVNTRHRAESIARILQSNGFDAHAFHAEMESNVKRRVQDDFMSSKLQIVVSTVAFGMGIDKPDIRIVINFDLPSTIEQYSQQIGRAGRDGVPSQCMLYLHPSDLHLRECFTRGELPSQRSICRLLKDIFDSHVRGLQVDQTFKKNSFMQGREFDLNEIPLQKIYTDLDLRFGLIRKMWTQYGRCIFKARRGYHDAMKSDPSSSTIAIRVFAEKNARFHHLDIHKAAHTVNIPVQDIYNKLKQLERIGFITLEDMGLNEVYCVLGPLPGTDEEINDLAEKLHADLAARERENLSRTEDMIKLITGNKCYSLALAEYFGAELPDCKDKCGHCNFCVTGEQIAIPQKPTRGVDIDGVRKVLDACDVRDDPRFLAMLAFGVGSPRTRKMRRNKRKVLGILKDHDFEMLLYEFTKACRAEGSRLDSD